MFALRHRTAAGLSGGPPAPPAGGQMGLSFVETMPLPAETQPLRERRLWSVAELVSTLRGRVEREYADEWVEGEISNCRPASSGHLYFTLKDGDAQLPVVLFRRQAALLRFKPQDGHAVLVKGRVSVFESRGQLQLIAESLEPRGAGALQIAFEQLKAKLRGEGLFEAARKRELPPYPKTIGVITSAQGAVIRDIVSVCRRRHACLDILVYPATMQGPTCAEEVAAGVRYLNGSKKHRVEAIVIARGGGSFEDLSGFNDETLARAIAASALPTVSAVGHETDVTIADFVADLRAPTPSAAAELMTAAQHRVDERVRSLEFRLARAMRYGGMQARQRLAEIDFSSVLQRMRDGLGRRQQRVDDLRLRLETAMARRVHAEQAAVRALTQRLREQDVRRRVSAARAGLDALRGRLERAGTAMVQPLHRRRHTAEVQLRALSPHAVLERGYALVFREDGSLLRSAEQAAVGDQIRTRLGTGELRSRVTGVRAGKEGRNG